MSLAADQINAALQLYRIAEGTEHEEAVYAELNAVIARVKLQDREEQCCGGRCRFCPWRER